MDNNLRGCLAEYSFAVECLKRGYNISFPLLDSCVYDCIVDTGKKLFKVQVKSTTKTPDTYHTTVACRISNAKVSYTLDRVDYFAVWVDYFDGFFIFKNLGNMRSIRLSKKGKHKNKFNNFVFE